MRPRSRPPGTRGWNGGAVASILEHPAGGIVQVVELPVPGGGNEERQEDPAEQQGRRNEYQDAAHGSSRRTSASTREAPQMTMPLDNGMSTAATSGFTRPAAAAPTDNTL